jgi:putative SOS response-associated peptidase YedK
MCGRFTETLPADVVQKRFHAEFIGPAWHPTYNAAPSDRLPIITIADPHHITGATWGMLPQWMKGRGIKRMLINARAENIGAKPTFWSAVRERRCLVIADGFYEWKTTARGRIPYRITLKNNGPFAFAGLWEQSSTGITFVIITVEPNRLMAAIHDRMPALLHEHDESVWLDTSVPLQDALELLKPYPASSMRAYEVSTLVNKPSNNSPTVIEPV